MAFEAIPYGIEVALQGQQDGQRLVNTFGFVAASNPPTDSDLLYAQDQIKNMVNTYYKTLASVATHFDQIVTTDVSRIDGHQFIYPLEEVGEVTASNPLPLSVAAVVSFKPQNHRGRGSKGRVFVFGLTEADTNGDTLVTRGDWQVCFASLLGSFAPIPGGPILAVLSRKHHLAYAVSEVDARSNIGVMKDRLPNHRRRRVHP